jgi:hypothetical protein
MLSPIISRKKATRNEIAKADASLERDYFALNCVYTDEFAQIFGVNRDILLKTGGFLFWHSILLQKERRYGKTEYKCRCETKTGSNSPSPCLRGGV